MTIRGGAPGEQAAAGAGDDLTRLMARIAARDTAAFAALYKQTSAKLYGVVARILTRGDVASDVLQEAYVRIWEKAGDFDPVKGSPLAWMATIARNRALDEVRRVRPVSLEDQPEGFEPAAEEIDPLGARERSEGLARLINCLKGLDDEKRAVVLLAYYRGLSREALAKRFGRPVPTIKTWLHRSLAQLRDCLGVMTVSPDDDFAAAEYVLGTLDGSERATLAARRLREPDLDEAIRSWEARMAPLAEVGPEIEPPRDLLPAIEARIRGVSPETSAGGTVVALERSVRRWRAAAIAASLVAALLAIGFAARETSRGSAPREYVGDPAEGRGFAGLRGHRQSRQAGADRSPGLGASAARQVLRTLDH